MRYFHNFTPMRALVFVPLLWLLTAPVLAQVAHCCRPSIPILQAGKRMLALPFFRENNTQNAPSKTIRAEWRTPEGIGQTDLPLPDKLVLGHALVFSRATTGHCLLAYAGRIYNIEKGRCTGGNVLQRRPLEYFWPSRCHTAEFAQIAAKKSIDNLT
jgi:hypothetical protein